MTVARMRVEVSNDEYVRWFVYYGRKAQQRELETLKAQAAK